jgi:hypothetical protein
MSARTENDIFEQFRVLHPADGIRWTEYWRELWMEQIDEYQDLEWWVFPCGKYSKRPVAGWKWSEKQLHYDGMIWYAGQGYNLAVKLGELVVLDYDSPSRRPFDTTTLTMKTPKGYQYWCTGPLPKSADLNVRLAKKGFDTPRSGVMYALVPFSRTCTQDHGGKDDCYKHDFRYREWVNFGADPQPVRKVLRELLA